MRTRDALVADVPPDFRLMDPFAGSEMTICRLRVPPGGLG